MSRFLLCRKENPVQQDASTGAWVQERAAPSQVRGRSGLFRVRPLLSVSQAGARGGIVGGGFWAAALVSVIDVAGGRGLLSLFPPQHSPPLDLAGTLGLAV